MRWRVEDHHSKHSSISTRGMFRRRITKGLYRSSCVAGMKSKEQVFRSSADVFTSSHPLIKFRQRRLMFCQRVGPKNTSFLLTYKRFEHALRRAYLGAAVVQRLHAVNRAFTKDCGPACFTILTEKAPSLGPLQLRAVKCIRSTSKAELLDQYLILAYGSSSLKTQR